MSEASERSQRLRAIFMATVRALDPGALCSSRLRRLSLPRRVAVLAVGKAALGMAAGAVDALGPERISGVVVAPSVAELPGLQVMAAAHPRPDARSVVAAGALLAVAREPGADQLLALISGGASAMACAPVAGVSLQEKLAVIDAVMAGGAPIAAINTVRKHLSAIKGGRLLAAAAAPLCSLLISDVVGDELETIGSGPTVPDSSTAAEALATIERFAVAEATPAAAIAHLRAAVTARPAALGASPVGGQTILLAGLAAFVERAAELAGTRARIVDRAIQADVVEVAGRILRWIDDAQPGEIVLAAGEPTVRLPSQAGIGGRASQLALLVAERLRGRQGVSVLIAGSDGIDGCSQAAGAVVDGATWNQVSEPAAALVRCDAATALAPTGALVVTGPTGVNHADFVAIAVDA